MKKTLLFIAIIFSGIANAQLLYTFDSVKTTSGTTDPSFVPVGTGLTCGSFTAIGTPPNSLAAFRFDFSNWALGSTGGPGDTLYSGMTGIVNLGEYYEVTLTPSAGYTITGDSIKFDFERSGTGVRTYCVRSSLDGYASNLTAVYGLPTTNVDVQAGNVFFLKRDITTVQTRNIIVLGASFMNLSAPVTFRFYAYNAEGTGGTFSIDNVNFIGSSALATGIAEKNKPSTSVYPNPSNGNLNIQIDNFQFKTTEIEIYNIISESVFNCQVRNKIENINLTHLQNGLYFVVLRKKDKIVSKKNLINK